MSWWSSCSRRLIGTTSIVCGCSIISSASIFGPTVTPVAGTSALRIAANGGSLPQQIDLWLDVASYDVNNAGVKLAAKKNATVKVGDAVVGFVDIRDGQWNIDHGQFTTVNHDWPQTTLQLKATGPWTAGRYQIAAISKANEKYISDFFVDLSSGTGQYLFFPFGMDNIDHFELRPLAEQAPFFFDGVALPAVAGLPAPASRILRPVVIDAGQESRVRLPSGAVVQLLGIAYDGPAPHAGGIAMGCRRMSQRKKSEDRWPGMRIGERGLLRCGSCRRNFPGCWCGFRPPARGPAVATIEIIGWPRRWTPSCPSRCASGCR